MASFVVWNLSAGGDGKWKTVEADDARSAAELVCGANLRSFGLDSEICVRVRALDSDDAAVLFYSDRKPAPQAQKEKDLVPAGS